jgi:peptidyl-prolyl cis-trans isomerase D
VFSVDALQNKRNTEAIEAGPNQLVSARVVNYRPAHVRALAEVRPRCWNS